MENLQNSDCIYYFQKICCACEAPTAGWSCCRGIKDCDVYETDTKKDEE